MENMSGEMISKTRVAIKGDDITRLVENLRIRAQIVRISDSATTRK